MGDLEDLILSIQKFLVMNLFNLVCFVRNKSYIIVTYYLSTSYISDSITDNAYLSSTLPKTFIKVDIILLVYTLLLEWINLIPFHIKSLHY